MSDSLGANSRRAIVSRNSLALILLGVASLIIYRIALRAEGTMGIVWFLKLVAVQAGLYVIAVWLILRARFAKSDLIIAVVFGVLFRLSILFSPPYLSDDIYRYVWDGRVQAAGVNPYRYIPADSSLAHLRDKQIYPKINRREYARTMYPPVAEIVYLLTTRVSESVTWMKATMLLFEGVAVWAMLQLLASFGLPRRRILIYAWHPLVVWEFAGSGHLDAIAIAFITLALLARRKNVESLTGMALACATLVKLFPLALFPALYKRRQWRMPLAFSLAVLIAYAPYLRVGPLGVLGFLPGYASERGMVSGEHFFILGAARKLLAGSNIPTSAFIIFACLVLVALAVWIWRKEEPEGGSYVTKGLIMATVFSILLAPHFPWYLSWLVPFLCLRPWAPIFYLTLGSFLLYLTWIYYSPDQVLILKAFLYVPFLMLGSIAIWWRHRKLPHRPQTALVGQFEDA
jgi:hypothetical protein